MRYSYKTQGTCATMIAFDYDNGIVTNVVFTGGCQGNLLAIPKLIDGWTAEQIIEKLDGNPCGRRPTSCADQLAKALKEAAQRETETVAQEA
jgi:uncharacterized protein (TIGR03905 family)